MTTGKTQYILKANNHETGCGWGGYYCGINRKYRGMFDYGTRAIAKRFDTIEEAREAANKLTKFKFEIIEVHDECGSEPENKYIQPARSED